MFERIVAFLILFVIVNPIYGQDVDDVGIYRLIEAAHVGDFSLVVALVNNGTPVNQPLELKATANFDIRKMNGYPDLRYATPLKAALSSQHDVIAAFLLGKGARCVRHPDDKSVYSELYFLASRKRKSANTLAIASLLIEAGAAPNERLKKISTLENVGLHEKSLSELAKLRGQHDLAELLSNYARHKFRVLKQNKGVKSQKRN